MNITEDDLLKVVRNYLTTAITCVYCGVLLDCMPSTEAEQHIINHVKEARQLLS